MNTKKEYEAYEDKSHLEPNSQIDIKMEDITIEREIKEVTFLQKVPIKKEGYPNKDVKIIFMFYFAL